MDDKVLNEIEVGSRPRALQGVLDQIQCIARGGMSLIYRARQSSLDRFIVLKKLRIELNSNPEMLERFRREAKALASVLHQNIAHVYDFVDDPREPYILMEYIDGIDLSTVIEKVGQLPPALAAAILLGVAKGVSYIHAHNLVHRDIKPANIRLTTRGEVKLMDFGIVMEMENEGLTKPGMMVGSPSYLSPEQVLGDSITPKADVFLLGICLYEMLTGTRPFKEEVNQTIYQRIREGRYIPVRDMQPQVPNVLDRMVDRCLQKDPRKRFANVKALLNELEKFLGTAKSSRTEDLILKYLDEEALLMPSVPYTEIAEENKSVMDLISLRVLFLILAMGAGLFFAGLQFGKRFQTANDPSRPALLKSSR